MPTPCSRFLRPTVRNIGDELLEHNVSWKYYGDQWNRYLQDKYYQNPLDAYCNICNFFQYSTVDHDQRSRSAPLICRTPPTCTTTSQSGNLPAVSFVKPSGFVDGHPASSKLDLFEGFVKKIVDMVQANPALWQTPPSSSPSTKAAATTTPATCSRWTSSATARAFR